MRSTFTYLFAIAFLMIGNCAISLADTYKKYHIREDFSTNAIPELPAQWLIKSSNSNNESTNPPYGGAAGITWAGEMLTVNASNAGGNRGAEFVFPTPQENPDMAGHNVIWMEIDWTLNSATIAEKNAAALIFLDSLNTTSNPLPIFGIYLAGDDGFFHYWNMDLQGPETETPGTYYGAVFTTANAGGGFRRAGANTAATNTLNESTRTTAAYTAGSTYHITAGMDFTNKQMVSLTITETSNSANTVTIENQPFIDNAATTLGALATINTRANNTGTNGNNVTFTYYFDNFDIYVNETVLGRADVTINYKDRDGAVVKAPRVIPDEPFTTVYKLLASDKARVIDNNFYYAYDAEATHTANAAKGADGERVTVEAGGVNLDVIFKKSALTNGTYVWTGGNGWNWNELEDNFSVNNGPNISYQVGNAVAFSKADVANKEIVVDATIELGDNDMSISAAGYAFSGSGKITGTGVLTVDAATVLGVNNQLEGGAIVNITDAVTVKHPNAATKFQVVDNASLQLEAGANFGTAIEGAGGILNINSVSNNFYTPAITNVSTVNIQLSERGRYTGSDWSNKWTATFPENAQINVTNGVEDGASAGFGVANNTLAYVKVHLGDSVRILRNYNEVSAGTDTIFIGELKGTPSSIIEGGFVGGRKGAFSIGSLNTDAAFEGSIRPFLKGDTVSVNDSELNIVKVGSGTWTLSGNAEYSGTLTVAAGTLELIGNTVGLPASNILVNSGGILNGDDATIAASLTSVNPGSILMGTLHFNQALLLLDINPQDSNNRSFYKPVVNSFNDGDFDHITAGGAITTLGALLDITVHNATQGQRITLLSSADPNFEGCTFAQVLVNGVDITANTETTEGAEFVWFPETCELLSLVDKGVGIENVPAGKTTKAVQYYDITGRPVSKETKGFIIKQVIYDDNTVGNQKTFVVNR